jgi:hypothetical protein
MFFPFRGRERERESIAEGFPPPNLGTHKIIPPLGQVHTC